jgi:hypothetical protein
LGGIGKAIQTVVQAKGISKMSPLQANKKGRGNIAPTFLISLLTPVPVHPWSKVWSDKTTANDNFIRAHQQLL